MILEPLNDLECLGQLTAIASEGAAKPEIKELAKRFRTTGELVDWIRQLPQRDDTGDPKDGPRVECDVMQRSRLVATDPNCVERAILYLAAAEVIDPAAARQLATIDISETLRHTFPVEGGEPVVLDPKVRRNSLRAGVWALRNGTGDRRAQLGDLADVEISTLAEWLMDLAEEEAHAESGDRGVQRVDRARASLAALLEQYERHAGLSADSGPTPSANALTAVYPSADVGTAGARVAASDT